MEAEIAMLESSVVVCRFAQDLHFFVTGGDDDNELILATVLQGFFDADDSRNRWQCYCWKSGYS
ncbi:hypothetical protein LguiB_023301 [Lonicera macranthoides]